MFPNLLINVSCVGGGGLARLSQEPYLCGVMIKKSFAKNFFFRDLQEIGMVSASEQKHLIEQARILHASKSRSVGYSQRCEMSLERGTIIGV